MKKIVLIHANVDIDALVSAFIYSKLNPIDDIVTDVNAIPPKSHVAVLDMPLHIVEQVLKQKSCRVEHYDHHDGSAPSTAQILKEKFSGHPRWLPAFDLLVDLANYTDTAQHLKLEKPARYFHISSMIPAMRRLRKKDAEIIKNIFAIFELYLPWLDEMAEAIDEIKDIPIFERQYRVAVVESASTAINQTLFENGVELIIFKDGNNIGVLRNVLIDKPDLNKYKDKLRELLKSKGAEGEYKEWFFHPNGFIMARGTRKHPAKTPSALTLYDLLGLF